MSETNTKVFDFKTIKKLYAEMNPEFKSLTAGLAAKKANVSTGQSFYNWENHGVPNSLLSMILSARLVGGHVEDFVIDKETKKPAFPRLKLYEIVCKEGKNCVNYYAFANDEAEAKGLFSQSVLTVKEVVATKAGVI